MSYASNHCKADGDFFSREIPLFLRDAMFLIRKGSSICFTELYTTEIWHFRKRGAVSSVMLAYQCLVMMVQQVDYDSFTWESDTSSQRTTSEGMRINVVESVAEEMHSLRYGEHLLQGELEQVVGSDRQSCSRKGRRYRHVSLNFARLNL